MANNEPQDVDAEQFNQDVYRGWPHWEEFSKIRRESELCRKERLARAKRKKWLYGLLGGGVGTFIAATVFVVKALIAAGASAEASRMQSEMVRESQRRIRDLENIATRQQALLDIMFKKP